MIKESHVRSMIKAITWRVFATLVTILLVFIFTKEPIISLEIGFTEIVIKLVLYYFHERIWILIQSKYLRKWEK